MRRLAVALACVALLSTSQAALVDPVSVALTVGQWIDWNQKKLYKIEVESQAPTVKQARDDGFRLAVEQAVGSLILSESHAQNSRLIRDDIINYSSGYVDHFDIISTETTANGVRLQMRVFVAKSKIANRLLSESQTQGQVDGEQLDAQVKSYGDSLQNRNRSFSAVLADYPSRAFDVSVDSVSVGYNTNQQPYLEVTETVRWSGFYLDAMSELLTATNQFPRCGHFSISQGWCRPSTVVQLVRSGIGNNQVAGYSDAVTYSIFFDHMLRSQPKILISLTDIHNRVIGEQCWSTNELDHQGMTTLHRFVNFNHGSVQIRGDMSRQYIHIIPLNGFPLDRVGQVKARIIPQNQCPNFG